jgi:uncharacterized protein involved in high-affinity Fe2+ transport
VLRPTIARAHLRRAENPMRSGPLSAVLALAASLALAGGVGAKEYPIGKPKIASGMEISAVYLEADIKATKGNANGFPEGEWVPYLVIHYELTKLDGGQVVKGDMMPMVANDGPHYGDNVRLMGPGRYKLTLTVSPPSENAHAHFGRHVDKETGVGAWFKTFTVEY